MKLCSSDNQIKTCDNIHNNIQIKICRAITLALAVLAENIQQVVRRNHMRSLCYCHITYTLQSESTLYSCLNVKELLARDTISEVLVTATGFKPTTT